MVYSSGAHLAEHEKKLTILEHLEELRTGLIKVLAAWAVCSVIGFIFSEPLLRLLLAPARPYVESLYFFGPAEAFVVRIKIALFAGLIFASPVIFYQIWMFIAPGLYEAERSIVFPSAVISGALFFIGVSFAYALALPGALRFFIGFSSEELLPILAVERYLGFVMLLLISFGVTFDLPVFIIGLVKLHVVKPAALKKGRKVAVVGAFILSAMLTPGDVVVTQLLLVLPMIVLYEVSVRLAEFTERRGHEKHSHG